MTSTASPASAFALATLDDRGLNAGFGQVQPDLVCTLEMPAVLRMLGGSSNFFEAMFRAVHAANRKGPVNDFVAITLPGYHGGESGLARLGTSVSLVGSKEAIARVMDQPRIPRPVLEIYEEGGPSVMQDFDPAGGNQAVALVRSRAGEKTTTAALRRRIDRLERSISGMEPGERCEKYEAMLARCRSDLTRRMIDGTRDKLPFTDGFVQVNRVKLCFDVEPVNRMDKIQPGLPPHVSTWGLSAKQAPLLFEAPLLNAAKVSRVYPAHDAA